MLAPRFALSPLLLVLLLTCAEAARYEHVFNGKVIIDAQQQKIQLRTKRETPVKHKTQHLKPAIEIEPINEKVRVAMPHFNVQDVAAYASQAAQAIASRFDEFEPQLLASNGELRSVLLVPFFYCWHRAPRLSPYSFPTMYGLGSFLCLGEPVKVGESFHAPEQNGDDARARNFRQFFPISCCCCGCVFSFDLSRWLKSFTCTLVTRTFFGTRFR